MSTFNDVFARTQSRIADLHSQIMQLQQCLSKSECTDCKDILDTITKATDGFSRDLTDLEAVAIAPEIEDKPRTNTRPLRP